MQVGNTEDKSAGERVSLLHLHIHFHIHLFSAVQVQVKV